MVGSWCSTMYRRRRLHATRSWSRSGVPPSIIWILSRPPERQDRYSRSTCRGYLVMSFQGSSNRLAVTFAAYAPGDAVFAANETGGAYAEYLAVKPAAIARKPSNLSFEEAASVPVASQTAWQGLFTHGHLEKGQTILIHGGAGAVGAYAVQLASHAGATVIATASGDDEAYLNSIGASRVIDYREE